MLHRNLRQREGYGEGVKILDQPFKYAKFGQLIVGKFIKIIATRCRFLRLNCTKFDSRCLCPFVAQMEFDTKRVSGGKRKQVVHLVTILCEYPVKMGTSFTGLKLRPLFVIMGQNNSIGNSTHRILVLWLSWAIRVSLRIQSRTPPPGFGCGASWVAGVGFTYSRCPFYSQAAASFNACFMFCCVARTKMAADYF